MGADRTREIEARLESAIQEATRAGFLPGQLLCEDVPWLLARVRELEAAIEMDAADRAYAADMGASEWEAFVSKRLWAVLSGGSPANERSDSDDA